MLSFDTGIPIAKIINSDDKSINNKFVRINLDNTEKKKQRNNIYDLIGEDEIIKLSNTKRVRDYDRELLEDYIYNNKSVSDEITNKYKVIKTRYDEQNDKELILHSGQIVPYPTTKENQRDVIYISAPSGSGKSTWCKMYIEQYKKQFPRNRVILFSRVEADESLDSVKPIRIKLDEDIINDPIRAEELKNALVIFDDCDTIQNKLLKDSILKLRNDLLETGRHTNTYLLVTSHLLMNYKETRTILNEATLVVVFPSSGSTYHIQRFMKVYAGMNQKQIQKAISLPSRWVGISKVYPQYIIYSTGIYLLSST